MPILDNEIVWRPSALVSDSTPAQNGGRMANALLVSGVKNNLFPDVSQAERLAGSVKWRKAFVHVNSAQDTALLNVRLFLDALTPAGDFVLVPRRAQRLRASRSPSDQGGRYLPLDQNERSSPLAALTALAHHLRRPARQHPWRRPFSRRERNRQHPAPLTLTP